MYVKISLFDEFRYSNLQLGSIANLPEMSQCNYAQLSKDTNRVPFLDTVLFWNPSKTQKAQMSCQILEVMGYYQLRT